MELVTTRLQIESNIAYLDEARKGTALERKRYAGLIQKGTCFIAYRSDDLLAFAPSRFIGYQNNTFDRHARNQIRNGTYTNMALKGILESAPTMNAALEVAYKSFCVYLGFQANATGTAGNRRKYWILADPENPIDAVRPNVETAGVIHVGTTHFDIGRQYSRDAVADLIKLPTSKRLGHWTTGYSLQNSEFFVFANVGAAARTGHDYPNHWDGRRLIWFAKRTARPHHREVEKLISRNLPVHIFWRGNDRADFTYAGLGNPVSVSTNSPIQIVWSFDTVTESGGAELDRGSRSRRGPPPTPGTISVTRTAGETFVYLMMLKGPVSAVFPSLAPGARVVKVGMSNDPERRREEMCWGLPRACTLRWHVIARRQFHSGEEAYRVESRLLEQMRTRSEEVDGEFAIVNEETFRDLENLGATRGASGLPGPPAFPERAAIRLPSGPLNLEEQS